MTSRNEEETIEEHQKESNFPEESLENEPQIMNSLVLKEDSQQMVKQDEGIM